jgi:tetratricopeptide (TPR) repeat protein
MICDLYEEAIEAFNEAIALDPNLGGFYTMRGYCYSKIEKYKEAIEDFNKAIELDSEDAQNYTLRGAVFGIIGKYVSCCGKHQGSRRREMLKRKGVERQVGLITAISLLLLRLALWYRLP